MPERGCRAAQHALLLPVVLLLLPARACLGATAVLDLSSKQWILTNGNGSIMARTTLPAYPLEVLRKAGTVQDPLYRYGEQESRWVAIDTWTFTLPFSLSTEGDVSEVQGRPLAGTVAAGSSVASSRSLLHHKEVVLQLGGIDTFANITLNGWRILQTDNFHRSWRVPVKRHLLPGRNELIVALAPAFQEALNRKNAHPYTIPTLLQLGSMGVHNFARKPASDFGWDWGPAFAASGIHGKVELVGYDNAVIAGAHVIQEKAGNDFTVSVTAQLMVPPGGDAGRLTVSLPELNIQQQQDLQLHQQTSKGATSANNNAAAGLELVPATVNFTVPAEAVELWWPVGYGQQKLYDLTVQYQPVGADQWCGDGSGAFVGSAAGVHGRGATASLLQAAGAGAPLTGDLISFGMQQQPQQLQQAQQKEPIIITVGDITMTVAGPSATSSTSGCSSSGFAVPQPSAGYPECSTLTRRVGFRAVELVTDPLPKAAHDLLSQQPGWADPNAAAEGQFGPQWPAANSSYGPVYMDGQWGRIQGTGVWSFLANPPNKTADEILMSYPHSGLSMETPPGEQNIAGAAIAGGTWDDLEGESFYFRVNGLPIFAKGANIIPFNILPSNISTGIIRQQLAAALEANMNMVRIWGGGMYQVQELYDFCDEHGLMVWQEAMFACGPYPRDGPFLESVQAEMAEQVGRLSFHPSIVVWGGNNEIEASFEWFNITRSNPQLFAADFTTLFVDTVRATVKKFNPSTPFLDSSPTNGPLVDDGSAYVKRWGNPQSPLFGDVHYYNYTGDCEDFRTFPQAKFVSEFGFQSYPTLATYQEATSSKDWSMAANMTEYRQRHPNGTVQLVEQFARHFKLPLGYVWSSPHPSDDLALFKSFIYLGHLQQLRCYEAAISAWRRLRSQPQSLTMGVLYWQLGDIWAGASWSSIDYAGRWKPLHYAVKRMYAPLAVQAVQDGNDTQVFVVNDRSRPVATSISIELLSLADSASSCSSGSGSSSSKGASGASSSSSNAGLAAALSVTVPALYASKVWSMPTVLLLAKRPGCSRTTCFVRVTATPAVGPKATALGTAAGASSEGIATSTADLWLAPFRNMTLPKPNIQLLNFQQVSNTTVKFTVKTDRPAAYVSLHTGKLLGHFSDDAVTVHPCTPMAVLYTSHDAPVTAAQVQAMLSTTSLVDHQQFALTTTTAVPATQAKPVAGTAVGSASAGARGAPAAAPTAPAAALLTDDAGSRAQKYIVGGFRSGSGR